MPETIATGTLPAAGDLVRHSGTMLLITRLTEASETHAVSEVAISENSTFYREGRGVPAYVGLEYMAQTIAAYDGVERRQTGKPPEIGFLLGTRRFEASHPWFKAGETLRIRVEMTFNDNGMAAFDAVITVADETRARASINVYRPESGGLGTLGGGGAMSEAKPRPVLVTGASKGIGRAIAVRIARDGFPVTVHYGGDEAGAKETLRMIESEGGSARTLGFDVSDRAAALAALEADIEANGPYWGIVLNAGIARDNAFPALTGEDWDGVVDTNLGGFFNVVHPLVMPMIRRRDGGRVVTISSVSGITGNRGQVNYSAAKAGIIGATKALAVELATRKITVNCVAPGVIETAMIEEAPVEEILKMIPMQRLGKPDEISGIVAFILSEEASYMTRQVISVNGGMC